MAHRSGDPYAGFGFIVEIDGSTAGAFKEVSGLGTSIDVVEYRSGADPTSAVRKLPGLRKFTNVTLKRGVVADLELWSWIASLSPDRRSVAILMLDEERSVVLRFLLHNAWPCRWEGPTLNATGSAVALESLELTHERLDVEAG
jgi:phage tail-like protein